MDKEKLRDAIWLTRVSRVNAERRLLAKNNFIQGINIYYSCITIVYSFLSIIYHDDKLSLITLFMTVSLLVTILYLNSLHYAEQANDYRQNYTKLHKLELELNSDSISPERISDIQNMYCDLLNSSYNHITFDYCCTIKHANDEIKLKNGMHTDISIIGDAYGALWLNSQYVFFLY